MTDFDLFQRATCHISDGNRKAALRDLDAALRKCDPEMREPLQQLRDKVRGLLLTEVDCAAS